MTYRQIINSVLRRLREDSIATDWSGDLIDASGPSDYQVLIGDFVNEVKREVEDAWDWTSLRTLITVNTVADTKSYALAGSTQRSRMLSVQAQGQGNMLQSVPDSWIRSTDYPIDFYMVDAQDDLTNATTALTCPEFPVIMGAWARAIAERGEDGGTLSDMAQMQYQQALSDAIQQDVGRHSSEVVWYGS